MKTTVQTINLKRMAHLAKRVAHDKSPLRDYNAKDNFTLSAAGGRVSITATDSDIDAFMDVPANVQIDGSVHLPAADLHKAAVACGRARLADTLITSGGATVTVGPVALPCKLGSGDVMAPFPLDSHTETRVAFTMPELSLLAMIEAIKPAISTEETRYYLNGFHLHPQDGQIRAVATDGHRLAYYDTRLAVSWPDGAFSGTVIVRAKFAHLIAATIKAHRLGGDAFAWINDSRIGVRLSDGTVLAGKLIAGTYPDYDRVVPHGNKAIVDGFDFWGLGQQLKDMGATKSRIVVLDSGGSELYETKHDGLRWNLDNVHWTGPRVAFNAGYLLDIVKSYGETAGDMKMALSTDESPRGTFDAKTPDGHVSSPVLITAMHSPITWVLMPLRP